MPFLELSSSLWPRKRKEDPGGSAWIHNAAVNEKTVQAENDVGLYAPNTFNYEPYNNYTMEAIEEFDKQYSIELGPSAFNFATYYWRWRENMKLQADIHSTHSIPWELPAKMDPYSPVCSTSKGEVKHARIESTTTSQFYQSALGMAASTSASGSGDGQDPNKNQCPTEKKLPDDKIDYENEIDVEYEPRASWRRPEVVLVPINSDEDAVIVAVTDVAVRNFNQVHIVPTTSCGKGKVTVVSCDKNRLYHQRLTKEQREEARAQEVYVTAVSSSKSASSIDLMAMSSKSTSTSTLGEAFNNLVVAVPYPRDNARMVRPQDVPFMSPDVNFPHIQDYWVHFPWGTAASGITNMCNFDSFLAHLIFLHRQDPTYFARVLNRVTSLMELTIRQIVALYSAHNPDPAALSTRAHFMWQNMLLLVTS